MLDIKALYNATDIDTQDIRNLTTKDQASWWIYLGKAQGLAMRADALACNRFANDARALRVCAADLADTCAEVVDAVWGVSPASILRGTANQDRPQRLQAQAARELAQKLAAQFRKAQADDDAAREASYRVEMSPKQLADYDSDLADA